MSNYLSIDIGGTKIAAAIIVDGEIINQKQVSTPLTMGNHEIIENTLLEFIEEYKGKVEFCSIATAGVVSNGSVRSISSDRLWGHNLFNLEKFINLTLGVPVTIINDAQAAAYCEYIHSHSKNDMAYITVSTGVGGGLVINEQLLTGVNGLSGHIGHSQSDCNGQSRKCNCGRRNCLESIASGTAIAQEMKNKTGVISTAKDVFELYYSGDKIAEEIVNQSAFAIANAIADLKGILDLEHVVVGGSVGLAPGYLELITSKLNSLPAIFQVKVSRASCDKSSGLLGAYLWAKNNELEFA